MPDDSGLQQPRQPIDLFLTVSHDICRASKARKRGDHVGGVRAAFEWYRYAFCLSFCSSEKDMCNKNEYYHPAGFGFTRASASSKSHATICLTRDPWLSIAYGRRGGRFCRTSSITSSSMLIRFLGWRVAAEAWLGRSQALDQQRIWNLSESRTPNPRITDTAIRAHHSECIASRLPVVQHV